MKKNKTRTNLIMSIFSKLLIMLQPLIIAPYISRVLGANGLGMYSFSFVIANYFVIFTMLGINNFGNRKIAQVRDNKLELSKTFINIYTMQLLTGVIASLVYVIVLVFNRENSIFIWQALFVVSGIFDITWFFWGVENFKITIIRNTIIKITTLFLIFKFVNNEFDLWIYVAIMAGSSLLSQLFLWPFIKKHLILVKPDFKDVRKMIKPNLILFLPVVAISLYKQLSKLLLGILSTMPQLALFENAARINLLPFGILNAFSNVMLPKMSNMAVKDNFEETKKIIRKSMFVVMGFAFATAFGFAAIGRDFAPLFFGIEFSDSGLLIVILTPSIVFLSWANIIRTQYLIPFEKDKIFITSIILAAVINVVFNIFTLSWLGAIGAAISSMLAEAVVAIYQTVKVRRDLEISLYLKDSSIFMIAGILMYLSVMFFKNFINENSWFFLISKMLIGSIVYAGTTVILFFFNNKKNLLRND